MTEPVIEIHGLSYRYATAGAGWVLQDLDLRVEPGEYLLVSGASGSGKSTLCRLLNGLIPHFHGGHLEGQATVAGLDVLRHPVSELFAHVGLVPQNPEAQLFNNTVEHELAFGLESMGLGRDEIEHRVQTSAETLGIAHLLPRDPQQLSGGEQQLVAIAAAFAQRPQLLVLDEPYANLDPVNTRRVRDTLRRIHQEGTTILVAEHRLENVVGDASRMLVLHQGRIVSDGTPRAVLAGSIAAFGLHPPPVVTVAQALGLPEIPLTVRELVSALDGQQVPAWALPAPGPPSPRSDRVVLQVEDLAFAFRGKPVLRNIDLALRQGECLALVGANGSGKTTLIKHLNGLHRPARGKVFVLGQDTRRTKTSRLARHVGLAFQNANSQFFKFSVRDEIEVGARALNRYDERWLQELIALFQLGSLLERSPYRLSEGEKKRVAFAAALAAHPEILVLDEPTTGQDWPFRRTLGALLTEMGARGQTIVLATHDLEFAERYANRWTVLAQGEIVATGHPWEVMSETSPIHRAGLEPTQTFRIYRALVEDRDVA